MYYALRYWAPQLPRGSIVAITTDNLGNAYAFNFGSSSAENQALFAEIWAIAAEHGLYLVGDWIPRDTNMFPDALSRLAAIPLFRLLGATATDGRWEP